MWSQKYMVYHYAVLFLIEPHTRLRNSRLGTVIGVSWSYELSNIIRYGRISVRSAYVTTNVRRGIGLTLRITGAL